MGEGPNRVLFDRIGTYFFFSNYLPYNLSQCLKLHPYTSSPLDLGGFEGSQSLLGNYQYTLGEGAPYTVSSPRLRCGITGCERQERGLGNRTQVSIRGQERRPATADFPPYTLPIAWHQVGRHIVENKASISKLKMRPRTPGGHSKGTGLGHFFPCRKTALA